jgi:hypothetical protein
MSIHSPLLFIDGAIQYDSPEVKNISPIIRLHQLLVHSYGRVRLPHQLLGIPLDAYNRMIDEENHEVLLERIFAHVKKEVHHQDSDNASAELSQLLENMSLICSSAAKNAE